MDIYYFLFIQFRNLSVCYLLEILEIYICFKVEGSISAEVVDVVLFFTFYIYIIQYRCKQKQCPKSRIKPERRVPV